MKTYLTYLTIAATLASASMLGACNRQEQTEAKANYGEMKNTVSEKYDQAKADTREGLSDASITAKVKSSIIAEPGLSALAIDVDTEGGVVTLNGTVDSHESRNRAEEIAHATDGVTSVDNRLDIRAKS